MVISRRGLFALDFAGTSRQATEWLRVHRTVMACRFEVTLAPTDAGHVNAARAALDETDRIESLLTVFRETSELSRVNREAATGPVRTEPEVFELLQRCARLHLDTRGAFDITSTPLSRCWGFLRREGRLPAPDEIARARALVGTNRVTLDAVHSTVQFAAPGMALNLGAIGKGYAVDRMGHVMRGRGVQHALISAGGSSVLAIGGRGRGWTVDIRSRQVRRERLVRVRLRDAALGTSGAGEQFVLVDGVRYGHVIDPRTGWPARGMLSASVVTRDAATADALSTAFLIAGPELAKRYCTSHPETLALLMLDAGTERLQIFGSCPGAQVL
jgi:thiamine biosynthesis lipoprotein